MTDEERMSEIIQESGMNTSQFAAEMRPESKPQWLYDVLKGKTGISKDVSKLIVEKFPLYNIAWVCFGMGPKYSETKTSPTELAEDVTKGEQSKEDKSVAINLQQLNKGQRLIFERLGRIEDFLLATNQSDGTSPASEDVDNIRNNPSEEPVKHRTPHKP